MDNLKNIIAINFETLSPAEKYQLSKLLAKPKDFCLTYFNNLPYAGTKAECFNKLNDLHYSIFKSYMYSSYKTFAKQYSINIRNKFKPLRK